MESNEPPIPPAPVATPAPRRSTSFDGVFGIALPILCLVADPGVLRPTPLVALGPPMLAPFAVAAYAAILPAMAVLVAWLAWPRAALVLAGPLFAGGGVALAIGVALLPISLPACLVLIGLLGLVPFATAFVFFRNGWRALRAARAGGASARALALVPLLFVGTVGFAFGAQRHADGRVEALIDAATSGDERRTADAVEGLRPYGWLVDMAPALAAARAGPEARAERLERAWHDATGRTLREAVD